MKAQLIKGNNTLHNNPLIIDHLDKAVLFKDLPETAFQDVIRNGHIKNFTDREFLFHQGDAARSAFLILHGRLKLIRIDESGEEALLRYISAGEVTAVISTLSEKPYPVSAQIIQSGQAIAWDGKTLRDLMQKYPVIAMNALDIVIGRLCEVQSRFLEMSSKRVEQRIARTLLRLMKKGGTKTDKGIQIDFPLSRQDIAEHAGTTLYTVSRTLSAWEKRTWISSSREKITISDLHALVTFAEDLPE